MFKSPEFNAIRDFSESEFLKYSDYIVKLVLLKNDENLFKIVELNYKDFKSRIENITKRLAQGNLYIEEQEYLHLEVNRLILNFLSSVRTYLDHTETRFKREYGANSEEFMLFKSETIKAYDENFEYRFLYKLRNFSQHCGLPAGSLKTSSFIENGIEKHVLKLSLLRDDLLKNFDWGNPITKELTNQEELFDLLYLIDTKYILLEKINNITKDLSYKHYTEEGFALLKLLEEIKNKDGTPCILKMVEINKKSNLNIHWFPFESIFKITGVKLYSKS